MDEIITQFLERGEAVPNWREQGVNVRALVDARPGGPAGQMIVGTTPFGTHSAYLRDEPTEALLPTQWFLVGQLGDRVDGGSIQIEIAHISPKVIMVERVGHEQLGNAVCRLHAQTWFYADPAVPASEMDTIAIIMSIRMLLATNRQNLCAIFEEREPGRYVARHFDRSGRRLPRFDAESGTYRIVARTLVPAEAPTGPSARRPDRD